MVSGGPYRELFAERRETATEERERLYRHLQSTSLQSAIRMTNEQCNAYLAERARILRRIEQLDREIVGGRL